MRSRIGAILLLVIIFGVIGYSIVNVVKESERHSPRRISGQGPPVAVRGLVSPENIFVRDSEVIGILRDKYGVSLDTSTRESGDMASADLSGQDFVWPADDIALAKFRQSRPGATGATVFRSPLVIYTWDSAADALVRAGIAKSESDGYLTVDVRKLADAEVRGRSWGSLGVAEIPGSVKLATTDPVGSSSGRLLCALIANAASGNDLAEPSRLQAAMPAVRRCCAGPDARGRYAHALFEEYLKGGMVKRPLIIGYEAEFVEYTMGFGEAVADRRHAIRILYPRPAIWSAHTLIPITANGQRLLTALGDTQLQNTCRRKHGFRPAAGAVSAQQATGFRGMPATIEHVVEAPTLAQVAAIHAGLNPR